MNDDDYKQLDALFADHNAMRKALAAIAEMPVLLPTKISTFSKHGQGMMDGTRACANVAIKTLKELQYGLE